MRAPFFVLFPFILSACLAGPPANGPECSDIDDIPCPGGEVCIDFECRTVCELSRECGPAEACIDQACIPYTNDCTTIEECAEGFYCQSGACRKKEPIGAPCGSLDDACDSGACADGVCCDSHCDATCATCIVGTEIGDGDDGTCHYVTDGEDPGDLHCPGPIACDGSGDCHRIELGQPCTDSFECISGHCSDGICCNGACDTTCEACTAGYCEAINDGLDPRDECEGGATCDGERACWAGALGDVCANGFECESGSCIDGVCCETTCYGSCQSCNSSGQCVPVANTTDPNSCGTTVATGLCNETPCTCDAAGECKASGAVDCSGNPSICADGPCIGGVCCTESCSGTCLSCDADFTGGVPGECEPILALRDPYDECNGTVATTCNGTGGCFDLANGQSCNDDGECTSGFCIDGTCCENACAGLCRACNGVETVNEIPGQCELLNIHVDLIDECAGGLACNGAGQCFNKGAGDACSDDSECQSGDCCGGFCTGGWNTMPSTVGVNLNGVWAASDTAVYAVGDDGTVLRFNGTSWNTENHGLTTYNLNAVSGSSTNNIVAVGANATTLRRDTLGWEMPVVPTPAGSRMRQLWDVWVGSTTSAFAVGFGTYNGYWRIAVQWDGDTWVHTTDTNDGGYYHAVTNVANDVYAGGIEYDTIFVVGPIVHRYDAGNWVDTNYPGTTTPTALVAYNSTLLTNTGYAYGGSWSAFAMPSGITDMWAGAQTIFAVGGRYVHTYDGTEWTTTDVGDVSLNDVWGASECNVFAVGDGGTILRYH